jgi:hypothetical protein
LKRLFFWFLLLGFVGLPAALVGIAVLALQDAPVVTRPATLTHQEIERARRIVERHDPRRMPTKVERTVTIAAADLDTALNYLASRYGRGQGAAKVVLHPGAVSVWGSVAVPGGPLGQWLNVEASIHETGALPRIESLRIGRVPVPDMVSGWLFGRVVEYFNGTDAGAAAADVIRGATVTESALTVIYQWSDDTSQRLGRLLVDPQEEERLRAYQQRLREVTSSPALARQVSLSELLVPLLRHASERSRAGDPVVENRAALLVLAFYVNGKGLGAIVPAARTWPRPVARKVTLSGREDFTLHFMVSAVLAAGAGGPLSDAVGVYKEVDDARRGSGFSFTDIAADRAGTRFGERATRSGQSARDLQARVVEGLVEADIMPRAVDLPEMMPEAEFKRRFGGTEGAAYRDMMREIERRLAALPLYR